VYIDGQHISAVKGKHSYMQVGKWVYYISPSSGWKHITRGNFRPRFHNPFTCDPQPISCASCHHHHQ